MREIPKAYDLSDQPPPRLLSRNKKFYFGICSEMYVRKVCATYSLAGSALRSILSSRSRGTRESRSTGGTWLTRLSSSTSRSLFASLSLGSVTAWDSLLTGQPITIFKIQLHHNHVLCACKPSKHKCMKKYISKLILSYIYTVKPTVASIFKSKLSD